MMDNDFFCNDDVVFLVDELGYVPKDLLLEHVPNAERRFKRVCTEMVRLLEDVRKVFPDAEYYTASGGFHLLLGKSHHPDNLQPQRSLSALTGFHVSIGDGDW